MSVPYALHAKTAESVTGGITESDPTYSAWDKSTGITITESQISDLSHTVDTDTQLDQSGVEGLGFVTGAHTTKYTDAEAVAAVGAHTVEVDGSITNEIELPTTANVGDMNYWNGSAWVVISTTANEGATLQMISGVPAWTGGTTPSIGDNFQGGKVAYIFVSGDPGYVVGETHGLIAAPSDQGTSIQWYNGSTTTGAIATALGTGNANTTAIVTNQGAGSYAAKICSDLVLGGYSDWYLP